ncbi:unnamed protein product [Rhodiola kirilowii]
MARSFINVFLFPFLVPLWMFAGSILSRRLAKTTLRSFHGGVFVDSWVSTLKVPRWCALHRVTQVQIWMVPFTWMFFR